MTFRMSATSCEGLANAGVESKSRAKHARIRVFLFQGASTYPRPPHPSRRMFRTGLRVERNGSPRQPSASAHDGRAAHRGSVREHAHERPGGHAERHASQHGQKDPPHQVGIHLLNLSAEVGIHLLNLSAEVAIYLLNLCAEVAIYL